VSARVTVAATASPVVAFVRFNASARSTCRRSTVTEAFRRSSIGYSWSSSSPTTTFPSSPIARPAIPTAAPSTRSRATTTGPVCDVSAPTTRIRIPVPSSSTVADEKVPSIRGLAVTIGATDTSVVFTTMSTDRIPFAKPSATIRNTVRSPAATSPDAGSSETVTALRPLPTVTSRLSFR